MRIRRAAGLWAVSWWAIAAALAVALPATAEPAAPAPASSKPAEKKPAPPPASGGSKTAPPAKPSSSKPGKTASNGAPPAKPASKKSPAPKAARKPGSEPGAPDEAARRVIAGTPAPQESATAESPELRAMRAIDLALFPEPGPGAPWPTDDASPRLGAGPEVHATGLPPAGELSPETRPSAPVDLAWLRTLEMPDLPVRWDARVVRYLDYYRNDRHGRSAVALWLKKSGRYAGQMRRILREHGLPEDIVWLSLVESGMNPTIHSPAGAAGLWQFMPEGGRIYGLTVDRWVDERLDPERSTHAAARYLADLRQRFGGWELAFAAYNMGYGGLLAAIRKYNTNDYWELSRFEAGIPYETSLYVPKILAIAIVAKNRAAFGCDDVELDPPVSFDTLSVGSGVSMQTVASASGATVAAIETLNPQLVAQRTPPLPLTGDEREWLVRVPAGAGARAAKSIGELAKREPALDRHAVRWGESVDDVAELYGATPGALQRLNGLRRGEAVRPGTVLFIPSGSRPAPARTGEARPVVIVPASVPAEPGQRRVFYRVTLGDTAREVAPALGVTLADLARWNAIEPTAALHEGMTLQVYVPAKRALDDVRVLEADEARVLAAGSPEFFDYCEAQKGRKRVEITVREGDTFRSIAKKHNLSLGSLERINQRSRTAELSPGDKLVVYVPSGRAPDRPAEPQAPPSDDDDAAAAAREIAAPAPTEAEGDPPGGATEPPAVEPAPTMGAGNPRGVAPGG
jgi:membrane-bound lytic murein transglycosylase D